MRATPAWLFVAVVLAGLALPAPAPGQTPSAPPKVPDNPFPYAADEPIAPSLSLAKAAAYLDGVARFWMRPNSCGACHANFGYLMARPLLADGSAPPLAQTRRFLETRQPHREFSFHAESTAVAFALAWDDARAGALRPETRKALRRMWSFQQSGGRWGRMGCGDFVPAENDRFYPAVLAALAAGVAPEGYARQAEAQDGLTKVRRSFLKESRNTLHDEVLLLWASVHLDGLLTTEERAAAVRTLLAAQGKDGGWSFAALTVNAAHARAVGRPSDGYATGLVVFVLREAGVPADRPEVARGAAWLRKNQRVSGRWFTPTDTAGHPTEGGVGARDLYVQNLGTAFAVLALKACEGADGAVARQGPRSFRGAAGLALRGRPLPD